MGYDVPPLNPGGWEANVARAIHRQLALTGARCAYLDMRRIDTGRFPNVVSALRRAGVDPTQQLVPVAPAAHHMMGGIATDLDGRASRPGLYAVGDCVNSLSQVSVAVGHAAIAATRVHHDLGF